MTPRGRLMPCSVCMCMYVCMYVYIYICACMYVCMHVCMHVCMYACMHVEGRGGCLLFFCDSIDINSGVIPAGYQFAACFDSIDINAAGEP